MTEIYVVQRFIARINDHDVDGLCALLTPGHCFTDSLGHVIRGVDAVRAAWHYYFGMVPDYCIAPTQYIVHESVVAVFGTAAGTCSRDGALDPKNSWSTPAAWRVLVEAGLIKEWQVYADNEPIRQILARFT